MKNKCMGCEKRTITCHSDCEDYKKYCDWIREVHKKRKYDYLDKDVGWGYTPKRNKGKR